MMNREALVEQRQQCAFCTLLTQDACLTSTLPIYFKIQKSSRMEYGEILQAIMLKTLDWTGKQIALEGNKKIGSSVPNSYL